MEDNQETWAKIAERYEVSSLGRVRSIDSYSIDKRNRKRSKKGKVLSPGLRGDGYQVVNISGYGNKSNWKVHQIVAKTFIPNPNNLPCINHKNGIKTDNRVDNLEWCTQSYNLKHRYRVLGMEPVRNYGRKNGWSKPVLDVETGIYYDTLSEAAHGIGIKRTTLGAMLTGQNNNRTNLIYV